MTDRKIVALSTFDPKDIEEMPNDEVIGKCTGCHETITLKDAIQEFSGWYCGPCESRIIAKTKCVIGRA